MTVHVQSVSGSLLVYELDDNTPIRNQSDGKLSYLGETSYDQEVQVFMDNQWCNMVVIRPPQTIEVRLSIQTILKNWEETAYHVDEILKKAGCGFKEPPIISYRIMRKNEQ